MSDEEPPSAPQSCAHYWVLSTPRREGTEGVCKHCGAKREFAESDGQPSWRLRGQTKRGPEA